MNRSKCLSAPWPLRPDEMIWSLCWPRSTCGKMTTRPLASCLQKLSENNSDAELRQRAQTMLAQLVTMEEQMARYRDSGGDPRNRPTSGDPVISVTQTGVIENVDPSSYLREALEKTGGRRNAGSGSPAADRLRCEGHYLHRAGCRANAQTDHDEL